MIRQAIVALSLGASVALAAPQVSSAQGRKSNTEGSNGGFVSPARSGVSGLGAKNAAVDSAAGSPGSQPATSIDDRAGAGSPPATREGDVKNQVGILAPVALFMFLVLAGGLYWFVFRKPTTTEGESAAKGTNTR